MKPPNFFVVGMPRAGTTTLWRLLRAHPDIFMPAIKEPRHFDVDLPSDPYAKFRLSPLPHASVTAHRDHSQYLALFADADAYSAVGEASLYIRSRIAVRLIHKFNPTAKFVLVLRNPVDALYSLYHLHVRNGSIRCAFDDFFIEFAPWYQEVPDRLTEIRELFGQENVSLHLFEDLESDLPHVYRSILSFLELDINFAPEFAKHNSSAKTPPPGFSQLLLSLLYSQTATNLRSRFFGREIGASSAIAQLLSKPRRELEQHQRQRYLLTFETSIHRLSELTGRDLSAWL